MADAEIRFEREEVYGLVAVDTLLIDAIRRFGIGVDLACWPERSVHSCEVLVPSGSAHLSPLTKTETEHFERYGRRSNERLACEAQIVKPGEITIMTEQKKQETKGAGETKSRVQEEFEALPLDKKIASLLQMEAVTISEAFSYVVNSSAKAFERAGSVIEEFGIKFENEARKAAEATQPKAGAEGSKTSTAKPKGRPKRAPGAGAAKQ
jgi:ferredoxin